MYEKELARILDPKWCKDPPTLARPDAPMDCAENCEACRVQKIDELFEDTVRRFGEAHRISVWQLVEVYERELAAERKAGVVNA